MADVTISVSVSDVQYTSWLRTSYIGLGLVSPEGTPLIRETEFGPDQVDALNNFMEEAAREVLKVFSPRQGDLGAGPGFAFDGVNAVYKYAETEPVLGHAASIKEELEKATELALYTYVTYLWLSFKGKKEYADLMLARYNRFINTIDVSLYKLHD